MYRDQFGEFVCGYWGFKGKKDVKVGYKLSTFVVPEIFYQTIQFDDVLLKNYLVLYAKRKESGPKIRSLVLSRVWV